MNDYVDFMVVLIITCLAIVVTFATVVILSSILGMIIESTKDCIRKKKNEL